jgi:hypothetical protein
MKGETMRLTKSLLTVISALALATGTAFAGGDPMSSQSTEAGGPELLSNAEIWSGWSGSESSSFPMNDGSDLLASSEEFSEPMNGSDALALEQGEMIYYSEAIVLVPSVDTETPQG